MIGIDHRHIYDQVASLLELGAECVGFHSHSDVLTLSGFEKRFPAIPRARHEKELLENPEIHLIVSAAIPCDRAALAVEVMRHGKDVMLDKPGVISFEQLELVRHVQQETGRIFTINFTERFEVRAVTRATELVRAGAIGRVLQTVGLGPHRLNRHLRPDWFFDTEKCGGILVDIASHQIDQFLHFTASSDARIVSARVGNIGHPDLPGLQDFGEIVLSNGFSSGYIRVDWFTPDALQAWGDGRLFVLGTEGYIEVRKYIDVSGRSGGDHLFLVNGSRSQYIDCSRDELPYYLNLWADIFDRTETAMSHANCFKVCELALRAQQQAEIIQAEVM